MPPRKSHKKSKAGCQSCKQRRIKCNEVHPRCGNCEKHGISCDFELGPSTLDQSSPSFPRTDNILSQRGSVSTMSSPRLSNFPLYQSPSDPTPISSYAHTTRSLELRLIHHYSIHTCLTLAAAGPNLLDVLQISIPSLAHDAQYLMDIILAITALHLRTLYPEDKSLVCASHGYMVSALAQYASLLNSGVSESNAELFFSTSILIAFQACASRLFINENGGGQGGGGHKGYVLPLALFQSFQGAKVVAFASWRYMRSNPRVVLPVVSNFSPDFNAKSSGFFDFLLEDVNEQLASIEENLRKETKQAYELAVAFLNLAHQNPERRWIIIFAGSVPSRFVELLAQYDPRTLVIVACFYAMMKAVDDIWWLKGIAEREVRGVMSVLPEEWWPKMDWAVKVVNAENPLDENIWKTSSWNSE